MFPATSAFALLAWWAVPAYLVLLILGAVLRTYRWIYLLRPLQPELSGRRVMGIGLLGFAAIMFAPLRAGEVVRPWLLARQSAIGVIEAASTVATERIVDGLAVALILGAGLLSATPLSPLPAQVGKLPIPVAAVPPAATFALILFSSAFVALIAFYFFRDAARRAVNAIVGLVSPRLASWATQKVEQLAGGLRFLSSPAAAVPFLRDTVVYWGVCSVSVFVLLRGCGANVSFAEACVTMGIMGIGTLIPSGPGFFGAYQLSAYCGLAMFFPESSILSSGALFTFVSYTTQIVVTTLSCPLGYFLMASPRVHGALEPDAQVEV
jgi:glycosyltransferase 2 family protein